MPCQLARRAEVVPRIFRSAVSGRPLGRAFLATLAASSAPLAILGLAVALFLSPAWVDFEQARSNVAGLTGFSRAEVREVTGSILSDLVLGPPSFDALVDGRPVLDAAERSHMVDVRRSLLFFAGLTTTASLALLAVLAANRRERWAWRAAATGSAALGVATAVVALGTLVFFDPLFRVFHLVVFPQGNFEFDPRTQRLVQLFPERFWSETALALGAVVLVLAATSSYLLARRARRLQG